MPRFALGRLKQAQDKRDHIVRYFKRIHSPTASLAGLAGPFLNQESLGSCGPSSAVKVIRILQKIQGVEEFTAARLAIYYNTRKRMDTIAEDSGVDNRSMCKSLASDGYCHEELYPYNILNFTQPPSETCYAEGRENKVSSYATLPVDLDSIKACLDGSHKPYVLGFKVYKSMLTDEVAETGNVPNPGDSLMWTPPSSAAAARSGPGKAGRYCSTITGSKRTALYGVWMAWERCHTNMSRIPT